jgi:glycosyltransferase involved in cell wall biosynthesis
MEAIENTLNVTPGRVARIQSRLRVLFISHTYIVGVNQGKLEAIAATGAVEVGLLVPEKWEAVQWGKRLQLEQPYPQIKLYPAKVWFEGRGGAYVYPPQTLLKAILDFRPDILQIEEEVFSLSALEIALCARLLGKPMVLFGWENMDRQLSPFRNWVRQFVLGTAQFIIAGNHDGAALVKQWGYQRSVEIMPQMGVDTAFFAPPQQADQSEFCIGFVGRISYHKGIDLLIQAGRMLRERGHRFRLVFCGSGSDEPAFRQQAQEAQLDGYLTWRGGVRHDEVPQEMGQFDVLVLPSRTVETWKEQFGHVLIEAMAMGIPVVGSTCGEIPNVVGRSDLVFTEGNAEELAAILDRLISDAEWCKNMGHYSLDRVHQYYSHEKIAERLIRLWRSLTEA